MERVGDIGKNGGILFDRPRPTAGCSANGEEEEESHMWVLPCLNRGQSTAQNVYKLHVSFRFNFVVDVSIISSEGFHGD
jgi:hypothetical protein